MRALTAFLLIAVLSVAEPVSARQARRFDIPAQPLDQALMQFAAATGLQLLYDAALADGRRSSSASGLLEPRAALDLMLADTGLTARFTTAGAVVIHASAATGVTLAPITAVAPPPRIGRALDDPAARAYAEAVQRRIVERLHQAPNLSADTYEISVRLWVTETGATRRVEVIDSSGDRGRDAAFVALASGLTFARPPETLPQPMRVAFRVRRDR